MPRKKEELKYSVTYEDIPLACIDFSPKKINIRGGIEYEITVVANIAKNIAKNGLMEYPIMILHNEKFYLFSGYKRVCAYILLKAITLKKEYDSIKCKIIHFNKEIKVSSMQKLTEKLLLVKRNLYQNERKNKDIKLRPKRTARKRTRSRTRSKIYCTATK